MGLTEILFLAGIVLALSKIMTILLAKVFCAKPIPQGIRLYQEAALALVGIRLIATHVSDLGLEPFGVAVFVNLSAIGFVVLVMNARRVFVYRDRCPV